MSAFPPAIMFHMLCSTKSVEQKIITTRKVFRVITRHYKYITTTKIIGLKNYESVECTECSIS